MVAEVEILREIGEFEFAAGCLKTLFHREATPTKFFARTLFIQFAGDFLACAKRHDCLPEQPVAPKKYDDGVDPIAQIDFEKLNDRAVYIYNSSRRPELGIQTWYRAYYSAITEVATTFIEAGIKPQTPS